MKVIFTNVLKIFLFEELTNVSRVLSYNNKMFSGQALVINQNVYSNKIKYHLHHYIFRQLCSHADAEIIPKRKQDHYLFSKGKL